MDVGTTWTEADDVQLAFLSLTDGHPVIVVRSFVAALWDDAGSLSELADHVTPESLSAGATSARQSSLCATATVS
jgi:hypothetical protein